MPNKAGFPFENTRNKLLERSKAFRKAKTLLFATVAPHMKLHRLVKFSSKFRLRILRHAQNFNRTNSIWFSLLLVRFRSLFLAQSSKNSTQGNPRPARLASEQKACNRSTEETRNNGERHCTYIPVMLQDNLVEICFIFSRLVEFSTFRSDRSPSFFQTCPKLNKKREGVCTYQLPNFLFKVDLGVWLVKFPAYLTSAFMIGVQRLTGIKTGLVGRENRVGLT